MAGGSLESCEIRINWAGFFESYKQGIWNPPAVLTDYDLLVVTAGTGTCLINGKRHTLTARDVVLLRRGDEIRNPVTAGRLSNLFVHFDFMGGSGRPGDPPFRELPPRLSAPGFLSLVTALVERTIDATVRVDPAAGKRF